MELQEAVFTGNTNRFLEIYNNDPLILHKLVIVPSTETPLHVAALHGHVSLVTEIIRLCPELAESLDSSGSSPLHLAAAKGYLDIVRILFNANNEMCNMLNNIGLSPVHLAVTKGRVEVVKELVRGKWARVRTDQDETVLHLCVKHCQLEILKVLMESVHKEVQDLVDATDEYRNTILHLAVQEKHTKIVKYLLLTGKLDVNAKNAFGYTPLDILSQSKRGIQDWAIGNYLQEAGALKTTNFITFQPNTKQISNNGNNPQIPSFLRHNQNSGKNLNQNEWLAKKRDALMVVASLLAAMAFQVGVCPPGGVWQEDFKGDGFIPPHRAAHRAGEAVVAYNYPESYKFYLRANTISFVASLSTILLLISGLPFRTRIFMWILMGIMWLSITSMAFTYGYAIVAVTPKKDRSALRRTMYVAIPVWCGVMALLFLGHSIRLMQMWLQKKGIDMWVYLRSLSRSTALNNANGVPRV